MHRVLAALVAALALAAAGVPVAASTPRHCADCCRNGRVHAADAPMPDCCGIAPAERAVARENAAPRSVLASAMRPSPVVHVRAAHVRVRPPSASPPQLARQTILRI